MTSKNIYYVLTVVVILILLIITSCNLRKLKQEEEHSSILHSPLVEIDLHDIIEKGKLTALTDNSSTSFFIYRGQPMGYEYELLRMFCKSMNIELEIEIVENIDEIFHLLNSGKGDIVAANMTVTKKRALHVSFSEHLLLTKQVLIQKLPYNAHHLSKSEIKNQLIRNPIDLIDQEIHVRKNSSFYSRLKSLSNEIGGDINIIESNGYIETEHLIKMVAMGEIQYTIADENVAMLNKTYYQNIDIETAISFDQKISWAVRKNSPELLNSIDQWIKSMRNNSDYITIYNKYFRSSKAQKERALDKYSSLKSDQLSKYDGIIQARAKIMKWDWKLLASQIYQESRFNPEAISWAGAQGLMQVMPQTAAQYGTYNLNDPFDNITIGTRYLLWIDKYWSNKIIDADERIKFVLASYNAGLGHVIDARNLAKKLKKDPNKWIDNVDECILLKSKSKYYNDEVVKHGYCRGEEPYNYVREILSRYEFYKTVNI
jgi:membrane-bound lytic murein transglycosylase F